jgi:hypothetical protein
MPLPFNFVEQEDQNYYHDLKVFVMGSDVTPWLTSDVSITYAENGGMNTVSFTLSNQQNAFLLTEDNLVRKKFRTLDPYSPSGEYSELAKYQIWTLKNAVVDGKPRNLSHEVNSFGPIKDVTSSATVLGTKLNASEAQASATYRYPFSPGSLVFHKFDQIRIFAKNPLSASTNQWICVFTGFLDTKPMEQDLMTGLSTIRLTAQDIRYAMQRMRTQANPASSVGNQNATQFSDSRGRVKDAPDAGYFNDLVTSTFQVNHVLGGLTFQQSINFLLLGESYQPGVTPGSSIGAESGGLKRSLNSVGELKAGESVGYDPKDPKAKEILAKWNNLVMFGEFTDSPKFMTFSQMMTMGQDTHEWGKQNVWARKVHYLFPAKDAPNSNLVETSINQGRVTDKVQWASRLELILDVCENIDYVMYVSPLGDVIFEFPMWDFSPASYGPEYENVYKYQRHVNSRNINDEGGEAISAVIVQSHQLFAETKNPAETPDAVAGYASNLELTRTIYSNALASRIGVQVKTIVKPGITNPDALTRFGMIEFSKAIADYNKYSFKAQYRPFVGINRPVYDIDAYRIGCSKTVTTTWRLRDTVDMDVDLSFVRRGEIDKDGKITFRFITGGDSSPISYGKIYTDASIPKSGVGSAAQKPNGEAAE